VVRRKVEVRRWIVMLLADSFLRFLPPLAPLALVGLLAALVAAGLATGWLLGAANAVARRWSLWLLRGAILAIVIVVVFNPVRVDELPGLVERPVMFYLLDTSASMPIGCTRSRCNDVLARVGDAQEVDGLTSVILLPFPL